MGLQTQVKVYQDPVHTDATAALEEVEKGKIFYNNAGRQIGTYIPALGLSEIQGFFGNDVKSITLSKNNMQTVKYLYDSSIRFDLNLKLIGPYYGGSDSITLTYATKMVGRLIGFSVSGKTVLMPHILPKSFQKMIYAIMDYSTSPYKICVAIGSDTETSFIVSIHPDFMEPVTIFYK